MMVGCLIFYIPLVHDFRYHATIINSKICRIKGIVSDTQLRCVQIFGEPKTTLQMNKIGMY